MSRVLIELQRVQSWLFAVPRLRAMIGANTLLGEVLRACLAELAREQTSRRLAAACGVYPVAATTDDPLSSRDDPAASAFVNPTVALLRRDLAGLRFRISVDGVARDARGVDVSTGLPVAAPSALPELFERWG